MCSASKYIQTTPVSFAPSTLTHAAEGAGHRTRYMARSMSSTQAVAVHAQCLYLYIPRYHPLHDTYTIHNAQSFVLHLP